MTFADLHEDILVYFEEPELIDCDPKFTTDFHTLNHNRHADIQSYQKANTKIVFGAVFPYSETPEGFKAKPYNEIMKQIDFYHTLVQNHKEFVLIKNKEDVHTILQSEGRIGLVLHMEGLGGLTEVHDLDTLFEKGVRSMGLCWNTDNLVCSHCEAKEDNGLFTHGYKIVERATKLGLILDLTHSSLKTQTDILSNYNYDKLIYSHSGAWDEFPFTQNIQTQNAEEIHKRNGLLGITFYDRAIRGKNEATIADFILHARKLKKYQDSLAIGTDFFGFKMHRGLKEVDRITDLPILYDVVTRNFDKKFADQLFSNNVINFLENKLF